MTSAIKSMLERYDCKSSEDYKNALKEIIQEVALCGLSRGNFFKHAAFYGGTALRIFYDLDRFSEDMDFSLCAPNNDFTLSSYFSFLEEELAAAGFSLTVEQKTKTKESAVQSAFIKGETIIQLLKIVPNEPVIAGVQSGEQIKIKFEIDTNPPDFATFETKYALLPIPFAVKMYDESSLFAGKLHAVLCRAWKNRVKGRDFYDLVWYLSRKTKPNLPHLQKRLEQSGKWNSEETLTLPDLKKMLCERFREIDFEEAKKDVRPFIKDERKLELWSTDFFTAIVSNM